MKTLKILHKLKKNFSYRQTFKSFIHFQVNSAINFNEHNSIHFQLLISAFYEGFLLFSPQINFLKNILKKMRLNILPIATISFAYTALQTTYE